MRPGAPGVTVDAMRAVMSIAAISLLSACAATEGPLLHAAPAGDGGVPPAGGGGGESGGAASATGALIVPGMSFQYQLQGTIDTDIDAQLFVVDLFNADRDVIDELHAQNRVVAAYVSAGTLEPGRPDTDRFPDRAVGEPLASYPSESWLDVRDATVRQLMAARLQLARDKGFDGVVPTSLTAYATDSGFPLTAADQLDYTRWLAAQARVLGMAPAMTGDYAQVEQLVDDFDWAMHFGCIERGDCGELAPFVQRGKPVFDLEYEGDIDALCAQAALEDMNVILKRESLDAFREACP
jgi:hypothetical protein